MTLLVPVTVPLVHVIRVVVEITGSYVVPVNLQDDINDANQGAPSCNTASHSRQLLAAMQQFGSSSMDDMFEGLLGKHASIMHVTHNLSQHNSQTCTLLLPRTCESAGLLVEEEKKLIIDQMQLPDM